MSAKYSLPFWGLLFGLLLLTWSEEARAREEGEQLPEVLARVLPAVVKINIDQPAIPQGPRNPQLHLIPEGNGRMRFRLEKPGQQQEFEFMLPPGQDWQKWLQQNPQWKNWLRQFLQENPNGNPLEFFQNNANDAEKKAPRVLQVQPPEEEGQPAPPEPPVPPFAPDIRIRIPDQGNNPWLNRLRERIGGAEALFAQEAAGCIIRPEGYIVTAPGAMLQGAGAIRVTLHDERILEAQLVKVDVISDVAVLKIEAEDLPTVPFGDSDQVQMGEPIFSIGHPYGYDHSVSRGIISGRNRTLGQGREPARGLLQMDMILAPGSSGGPVINARGEVIGLNYAVFRPAGTAAPLSFALPSNTVSWIAAELIEKGEVERAWLGVAVREVDEAKQAALNLPEAAGALVHEVIAGSPSEAAGLQIFDVIQRVGDQPIRAANDLVEAIRSQRPGDPVELLILRNGAEETLTLDLGKLPPPEELAQIQLQQIEPPANAEVPDPQPPAQVRTRRLKVEVNEGRVQLEATNVPLHQVIRQLAQATETKILLDPAVVNQRITAQIDQPLNEALKELTEGHDLTLAQMEGGIYVIGP